MAHFIHSLPTFQPNRNDCPRLLLSLMFGSLLGAVCARLQTASVSDLVFGVAQSFWIPIWLRASLFPCLLAVSFLLRRRFLFYVLFFLKGTFVSFTLSIFALYGVEQLLSFLPVFLFQTMLPLPIQFYSASIWLQDGEDFRKLFLLAPMLFLALFGALIQMALAA